VGKELIIKNFYSFSDYKFIFSPQNSVLQEFLSVLSFLEKIAFKIIGSLSDEA